MSNVDKSPGPPRFPQIDLGDSSEVHRWCEAFNCTATDLKEAVNEVGPVAEDVHKYLSHRLPQTPDEAKVIAIAEVGNDARLEDLG